jgi:protein-S-isoprenylcysteine O-methyltransferase Ste14
VVNKKGKRMTQKGKDILLLLLAIVFSIALMFAFVELPRMVDHFLQEDVGSPGFDHGSNELNAYKTDLFIDSLYLRWIGYGSLLLVAVFIILGYSTRKTAFAWAGAFALFLPVFGQFALSMFFLAGLGILRVGWFPFMDISFKVLELGNVIYIPYWILMWVGRQFDWYAHNFLSYFFMILGSLIFVWSVLLWLRARSSENPVASNWIYRYSRHPQYLGWIIWSYGLMLFSALENQMKKTWSIPASLPWLLATMVIIGICLLEEIKMKELYGDSYQSYRKKAPFLFPLPKWLKSALLFPIRIIVGKDWPETRGQVAGTISIYTICLMLLSLVWVDFGTREEIPVRETVNMAQAEDEIHSILVELQRNDSRGHLYNQIMSLKPYQNRAVPTLIILLGNPNSDIREFSVQALGELQAAEATEPLIPLLDDSEYRVQRGAAYALGQIGSEQAVDPLIQVLDRPTSGGMRYAVYTALGQIGSDRAWPVLVPAAMDTIWYAQNAALRALHKIDRDRSMDYIIDALQSPTVNIRRQAVMVLLEDPHSAATDVLRQLDDDPDFETRFYSRQVLKLLEEKGD